MINNHVYVVSEATAHGMQIYDLTLLRTHPAGTAITPNNRLTGIGACHNIVSSSGSDTVFVVGCTGCSGMC